VVFQKRLGGGIGSERKVSAMARWRLCRMWGELSCGVEFRTIDSRGAGMGLTPL